MTFNGCDRMPLDAQFQQHIIHHISNIISKTTTMKQVLALISILAVQVVSGSVVKLEVDTFDALTAGKTVFIKFFAPWCGHCKKMAPDWEKLGEEWKDHAVGLIGDVDCTEESGKPLCEEYGVEGFPTLMFGDPASPEPYEGGRDLESLSAFAAEHLTKVYCSVRNIDTCTDEEKVVIADLRKKTKEELDAIVVSVGERTTTTSEAYDKAIEELQKSYESVTEAFNAENEAIRKESNVKWVNQILSVDHPEVDRAEDEL